MKLCKTCGIEKPVEEFSKAYPSKCKPCHAEYMKEYYVRNPEKAAANKAKQILRDAGKTSASRHRLTEQQVADMLSRFDGKCWACQENAATSIDHDHRCCAGTYSCGKCVRGLLCHWCNTALGLMKDDPAKLTNLIRYVSNAPTSAPPTQNNQRKSNVGRKDARRFG